MFVDEFDLDEEIDENIDGDIEQELDFEITNNFPQKVRELAIYYIDKFFEDKKLCSGGKIPKYMLHCPKRIATVMNYDISTGVKHAYMILKHIIPPVEGDDINPNAEASDIKLVTEVLNFLARSGVPQQFAGGIMVLYLELVEGAHCQGACCKMT